jgi:sugar phosphate isomerase/epimerase
MDMTKRDFLKLGAASLAVTRLFAQRAPRVYPKLGILINYTEKNMQAAAEIGCQSVQLNAGPGTALDPTQLSVTDGQAMMKKISDLGLTVSALNATMNHLGPTPEQATRTQEYFTKLIGFAADIGVKVIGTHTGLVPNNARIDAQVAAMKGVFTPYLELAAKRSIQLALENYPGSNFAITPENFQRIFDALPSPTLGLEFDPSHFVRQFIDPIPVARQYANRVYHVHAKDTEIIPPILQQRGITGNGWWRYRLPGFGQVKWNELITVLLDANYSGGIDIEHEDALFAPPGGRGDMSEATKLGFRIGLRYLGQYIPLKS